MKADLFKILSHQEIKRLDAVDCGKVYVCEVYSIITNNQHHHQYDQDHQYNLSFIAYCIALSDGLEAHKWHNVRVRNHFSINYYAVLNIDL